MMPLVEMSLKVKLHSFWHCGSGSGASAEVDSTPVRDPFGLPYVPGRTLRGILRSAASQLRDLKHIKDRDVKVLFGGEPTSTTAHRFRESDQGVLRVGSATMEEAVIQWFERNPDQVVETSSQFYRRLHMTAVDDATGTALTKSLRVVDVAVPLELTAQVLIPDEKVLKAALGAAAQFVQAVGAFRHRGLGQASLSLPQ